jgi:heme exporter protein A
LAGLGYAGDGGQDPGLAAAGWRRVRAEAPARAGVISPFAGSIQWSFSAEKCYTDRLLTVSDKALFGPYFPGHWGVVFRMLEVRDLECVRGDHRLFSGLSFELQGGELLRLRGSNGSGKTSLLRTVCGLLEPAAGEVRWRGQNIRAQRDEFHGELLYLGHHNGIKAELTGFENLRLSAALSGQRLQDDAIYDALERIGLGGREDLPTQVLSQGQKRRVALARLLLSEAELWVLDEPFTALDVAAVAQLGRLIETHLQKGRMVMFTTHQEVEMRAGALREVNLDS